MIIIYYNFCLALLNTITAVVPFLKTNINSFYYGLLHLWNSTNLSALPLPLPLPLTPTPTLPLPLSDDMSNLLSKIELICIFYSKFNFCLVSKVVHYLKIQHNTALRPSKIIPEPSCVMSPAIKFKESSPFRGFSVNIMIFSCGYCFGHFTRN